MASKGVKKTQSSIRTGSATNKEAASIAASIGGTDGRKQQRFVAWPEWSDADINAEKWDVAHKGKEKEKGKSPVVQHFFDDPDGKVELPSVLKVDHWKRPQDFITEKTPTIVDADGMTRFDLLTANDYVHESELMRWITSQIQALWKMSTVKLPPEGVEQGVPTDGENAFMWRPWEHIYAMNKVGRGVNTPAYNPHGKYVVRLYWMGCWRKLVVDDTIPFDDETRMLLPRTTHDQELWPMLLTKALIKVASLDYNGGTSGCEFGDFSVIHCLTGWLPEAIPLHALYYCNWEDGLSGKEISPQPYSADTRGYGHLSEVWNLLKTSLPEWVLPELNPENQEGAEKKDPNAPDIKDEKDKDNKDKASEKMDTKSKDGSKESKPKDKEKGKEDKKDKAKDKDKDKDRGKEKSNLQDEQAIPENPEIVVFAAYSGPPKYPIRISMLGEMADASERLRQAGLSHFYPHPVLITKTRSCPLEPPPPPEVVPAWKLIRPKKKKTTPSDEPIVPEKEKPIQCIQMTSPFINYKVSAVPIPTDTHRPKSALERGSTHTASVKAIEETDENVDDDLELAEDVTKCDPSIPDANKLGEVDTKSKKSVKRSSASTRASDKGSETSDKRVLTPKDRKKSGNSKDRPDSKSTVETKLNSKDGKSQAGGTVIGSEGTPAPDGGATSPGEETVADVCAIDIGRPQEDVEEAELAKPQDIWMDFENFCKCFKTLYIFHKPNTYACNYKDSDLKTATPASKDKKSAPNTAAVNLSSSGTALSATPRGGANPANTPYPMHSSSVYDERSPHYMFVDNLKPTEIVVSFSAVSRWNEPPSPPTKEESKTNMRGKDRDRDSKAENVMAESSSLMDGGSEPRAQAEPLQPGLLVAEPYSWKSLVTGQPILRLRSTATRAAVLSLPEGRHVLKFHMQAPLGWHVHLTSSTQFVFGDEEKVMAELTKESCRFVDNATQAMTALGKCVHSFQDPEAFRQAYDEYCSIHCPYMKDRNMSKLHHFQLYNEAFYMALRKHLAEAQLVTADMAFAWRAFNFDITTKNILGLPLGASRPGEQPEVKGIDWSTREITADEHVAAVKIQKGWKGFWVRKIKQARKPGMEENAKVLEQLQKAWAVIDPNAEQIALSVFRNVFKADPDLMPKYPFYKDEWNKISYADYQGSHPDQPPGTWFVVFREVFYVTEEMLCVPKLYVPIPTCMLRVVNNDNGEEIPRVFQKVAPYVYKKNKHGYTFVAEARTTDQPLLAGRWRMRLIGSLSPLPAPARNEVNASFNTREIRDYYIPNEKNIIFRYHVKVTEEHLVSLQVMTAKADVYVKLQVLDNEEEVMSAVGKGHVTLPAFIFHKDASQEDGSDKLRASSRASNKGSKATSSSQNLTLTKRKNSTVEGRALSRSSTRQSFTSGDNIEEEDIKPHKYIIQAQVLRNSWPLSESSWTFVQMLKELEKNELKVAFKERAPSPPRSEKMASAASSKGKGKDKGKAAKDKDKGSRPPSQQFDFTKPNWTLRVVSDGNLADDIEVKKDTERADEIRAMKKAWEDAEPGRAAKAAQSRANYLKSHMIKVHSDEPEQPETARDEEEGSPPADGAVSPSVLEGVESEGALTLEPPPPPTPKEVLQPLDITPFLRKRGGPPRIKDEAEEARQVEEKQQQIQAYRQYRDQVEAMREQDRQQRNLAKIKQLELCEQMQASLDAARDAVNKPREAFRQKFLEAERRRLEEIASQEAAMRDATEKTAPSPKGRKSAKGKKSPGGKKGKK